MQCAVFGPLVLSDVPAAGMAWDVDRVICILGLRLVLKGSDVDRQVVEWIVIERGFGHD